MRKLTIAALVPLALLLSACAGMLPAVLGAATGGPRTAAEQTTVDEQAVLTLGNLYNLAALLGRTAFVTGTIPTTQSPDALRDDFCQRVTAGDVELAALDRAGRIMAHDCRAYAALLLAQEAYETGNAASYRRAIERGNAAVAELRRLIEGGS